MDTSPLLFSISTVYVALLIFTYTLSVAFPPTVILIIRSSLMTMSSADTRISPGDKTMADAEEETDSYKSFPR